MNLKPVASVLSVGTELTTGQIINRNAAWISEKLVNLGIEVLLHHTVPDDRSLIHAGLDYCGQAAPLLFVTGGLGPTTDDFTREVISEWLGMPLRFHEEIWERVIRRLTDLGIPVAESNRQQCYFPERAEILENSAGTAAGFSVQWGSPDKKIWVLPGPPNEVSAIWQKGIDPGLRALFPKLSHTQLFTWQCVGKSEAEFGEITEKVLYGSGMKTGYRAHRPYVEIKIWCPEEEVESKRPWIRKLDEALSPWVLTRQGEDLARRLLFSLERSESVEILDSASGGMLAERLGDFLRRPEYQEQSEAIVMNVEWTPSSEPEEWVGEVLEQADDETVTLALSGFTGDGRGAIGLREGMRVHQQSIQTPYRSRELIGRMRSYMVEIALKQWSEWLDTATL